jgi:putative flavoprotein involved in K+ transport
MTPATYPTMVGVVLFGGGQVGLALRYCLRRTNLTWVILDAGPGPGDAWCHAWDSLHLFSPPQRSSDTR